MSMIHLLVLAVHLLATIAKLLRPGGLRAVMAESLLLKHQLVISSRARRRAPNLNLFDRLVLGLGAEPSTVVQLLRGLRRFRQYVLEFFQKSADDLAFLAPIEKLQRKIQ